MRKLSIRDVDMLVAALLVTGFIIWGIPGLLYLGGYSPDLWWLGSHQGFTGPSTNSLATPVP